MTETANISVRQHNLDYGYVDAGDARIGYRIGGAGHSVCLLPSLGRDCSDLLSLACALIEQGCRVILPDPRGTAHSSGSLQNVSMAQLVDDVAAVLRVEGGPATLAGHAYGCGVATTLAVDQPELVSGLVMMAMGAKGYPKELGSLIDQIADETAPLQDRRSALLQLFLVSEAHVTSWLAGWNTTLMTAQRLARSQTPAYGWDQLRGLQVLDLIGELDPFRPSETYGQIIQALGDRAEVKIFNGARHALPDEKPVEVAQAIVNWIKKVHS